MVKVNRIDTVTTILGLPMSFTFSLINVKSLKNWLSWSSNHFPNTDTVTLAIVAFITVLMSKGFPTREFINQVRNVHIPNIKLVPD